MISLKLRLLLAASFLLLVFLGLTGWTLNNVINNYSDQAEYDRLQSVVYMLLSSFDIDDQDTVVINDSQIREIRLLQPESGLIAAISSNGSIVWESTSTTIDDLIELRSPLTDEWQFERGDRVSSLTYGYEWVKSNDDISPYAITISDFDSPLLERQQEFISTMWRSLSIIGIALLLSLFFLLIWSLSPLKKISLELSQIKKGNAEKLSDNFPREIKPLTSSINRFIGHEQKQITRFRNSLADLAHSLKTPLAVIKADPELKEQQQVLHQVDQIDNIIHHQLSRAAASGRRMLAEPIAAKPVAEKIVSALEKVYREKEIQYNNQLNPDFCVPVNADDLTEVLGILLDNASKYGATNISISNDERQLIIEDNGPGVSTEEFEQLIQRGTRGDTKENGTGIGLAIAMDIVEANSGRLLMLEKNSTGLKLALEF